MSSNGDLDKAARQRAGLIVATVLFVEWGSYVVLRMRAAGHPFQVTFARAGDGHPAVLLVLALVGPILADFTDLSGVWRVIARSGIWAAAILFPAGVFPRLGRTG